MPTSIDVQDAVIHVDDDVATQIDAIAVFASRSGDDGDGLVVVVAVGFVGNCLW